MTFEYAAAAILALALGGVIAHLLYGRRSDRHKQQVALASAHSEVRRYFEKYRQARSDMLDWQGTALRDSKDLAEFSQENFRLKDSLAHQEAALRAINIAILGRSTQSLRQQYIEDVAEAALSGRELPADGYRKRGVRKKRPELQELHRKAAKTDTLESQLFFARDERDAALLDVAEANVKLRECGQEIATLRRALDNVRVREKDAKQALQSSKGYTSRLETDLEVSNARATELVEYAGCLEKKLADIGLERAKETEAAERARAAAESAASAAASTGRIYPKHWHAWMPPAGKDVEPSGVNDHDTVIVRFRGSVHGQDEMAGAFGSWFWTHDGSSSDIVEWRYA